MQTVSLKRDRRSSNQLNSVWRVRPMQRQPGVGFTIVELLVVVMVLALLSAILLPVFVRMGRQQKSETCISSLREIGVALTAYREDYGHYPPAPRPDYLASGGKLASAMPFTARPSAALVPADWQEWEYDAGTETYAYVPHIVPSEVKVGNFGLARLYYLYLSDQRDYLKKREIYHCPQQLATARVNMAANTAGSAQAFDPLWAGYNTYDLTYNYDQFYNAIYAFDSAMGFSGSAVSTAGLNITRQLRQDTPAADTVVCWCPQHGGTQPPVAATSGPDPEEFYPDPGLPDGGVRQAEEARRAVRDTVLWLDGTIAIMRPKLMKAKSQTGVPEKYFWVPPFLYSKGDWRKQ